MTLYSTTIAPHASFATPLRADTLFGQMCWSVRYLYGQQRLEDLLAQYDTNPFLIVSDPTQRGYLPRPKIPSFMFGIDDKKLLRTKQWITKDDLQTGAFDKLYSDEELNATLKKHTVMHNSINYRSFTTGSGFDPYSVDQYEYPPMDIYFLINEKLLSVDELSAIIDLTGRHGYGKDTTIGKGRFSCTPPKKVEWNTRGTTFMTLGPSSLLSIEAKRLYYEPFTRFGKSGGHRATSNPFKKPLILCDTGAVIVFDTPKTISYVGRAIRNISTAYPDIVHQGYAITIPIKELA